MASTISEHSMPPRTMACLQSTREWDSNETRPGLPSRRILHRGTYNTKGRLPVLRLKGSPYEIGYGHGKAAQDKIRHNLEIYFRRFKNETQLSRDEALARAGKYLRVIRLASPAYARAMEGVAMGANTR